MEEISSLHPAFVSLSSPSNPIHGVDHSAKKADAHFMGELIMNVEIETEADERLGTEPSSSLEKNIVSSPHTAVAPGAGPAWPVISNYIGYGQMADAALVLVEFKSKHHGLPNKKATTQEMNRLTEEVDPLIIPIGQRKTKIATESTVSTAAEVSADGRASLLPIASQSEVQEVEIENSARISERAVSCVGRSQAVVVDKRLGTESSLSSPKPIASSPGQGAMEGSGLCAPIAKFAIQLDEREHHGLIENQATSPTTQEKNTLTKEVDNVATSSDPHCFPILESQAAMVGDKKRKSKELIEAPKKKRTRKQRDKDIVLSVPDTQGQPQRGICIDKSAAQGPSGVVSSQTEATPGPRRSGRVRSTPAQAQTETPSVELSRVRTRGGSTQISRSTPGAKKLIRNMKAEEWWPPTREANAGPMFWTLLQKSFHDLYVSNRIKLSDHRMLHWTSLRVAAHGADIRRHFSYFPGLVALVSERSHYVHEWVQVFYATLWIDPDRSFIQFMFQGEKWRLDKASLAEMLGVQQCFDLSLHEKCYPDAVPPRSAKGKGVHIPSDDQVRPLFVQPFLSGTPRVPERLTTEANIVHHALRRSVLCRQGFAESITGLQQWLLLAIMTHQLFDIVDFFLCEMEEVIMDGIRAARHQPYAHWISWILASLADSRHMPDLEKSRSVFLTYSPASPDDKRRGTRGLLSSQPYQGFAPPSTPPPPVTAAQSTQPDSLSAILSTLTKQKTMVLEAIKQQDEFMRTQLFQQQQTHLSMLEATVAKLYLKTSEYGNQQANGMVQTVQARSSMGNSLYATESEHETEDNIEIWVRPFVELQKKTGRILFDLMEAPNAKDEAAQVVEKYNLEKTELVKQMVAKMHARNKRNYKEQAVWIENFVPTLVNAINDVDVFQPLGQRKKYIRLQERA